MPQIADMLRSVNYRQASQPVIETTVQLQIHRSDSFQNDVTDIHQSLYGSQLASGYTKITSHPKMAAPVASS